MSQVGWVYCNAQGGASLATKQRATSSSCIRTFNAVVSRVPNPTMEDEQCRDQRMVHEMMSRDQRQIQVEMSALSATVGASMEYFGLICWHCLLPSARA